MCMKAEKTMLAYVNLNCPDLSNLSLTSVAKPPLNREDVLTSYSDQMSHLQNETKDYRDLTVQLRSALTDLCQKWLISI